MITLRTARKSRGVLVATVLLSALGSVLLTLALAAFIGFPRAFEAQTQRLSTEDLLFFTAAPADAAHIESTVRSDSRVRVHDSQPVLFEPGTLQFGGADLPATVTYFDIDRPTEIGRSRILEVAPTRATDPAYLPLLYKTGGGYQLGDAFSVRLTDGTERRFTVEGFFENPFLGTTTMELAGVGLPHDAYQRLAASRSPPGSTRLVRAQVADPATLDAVSSDTVSDATEASLAASGQASQLIALTATIIRGELMNTSALLSLFLIGFSVLIVAVVMLMLGFLVRTAIIQDMPAIGVLKSAGFVSSQIIASLALPPLGAAVLGVVIGSAVGIALLDTLAKVLSSQAGVPWSPTYSPATGLLCLGVMAGGSGLAALASAGRVRLVEPVDALHGGGSARTSVRNVLPLNTAHGPVNVLLGLKQSFFDTALGLAIAMVIGLVTYSAVFSVILGSSVLGNATTMRSMTVGQMSDVSLTLLPGVDRAGVQSQMRRYPAVETAAYVDWLNATAADNGTLARITDDYAVLSSASIYDGREPAGPGEVAIGGRLARSTGLGVGDPVHIRVGTTMRKFTITGLISTVQMSGMRIDLTSAGYRRLVPNYQPSTLALFLVPDQQENSAAFAAQLRDRHGARTSGIADTRGGINATLNTYILIARWMGIVILGFAGAVACIVITLVVMTMLARDRQGLGIRKGVGFTSSDLITQTITAYLPAVVIGLALGGIAAATTTVPVIGSMLSTMGIMKIDVTVQPGLILVTTGAIGVLIVGLIFRSSARIRGISASELFRG